MLSRTLEHMEDMQPTPDTDDSRGGQARELRRRGLSRAQIRAEIGPVSNERLTEWLDGVPPPTWTRRPNAKDELRSEARRLRTKGLTYPEIAERLGVSKSSVSLWVRDLPAPLPDPTRRIEGIRRSWQRRSEELERQRQERRTAAARLVGELSERELLLVGAALYWAEGSKSKPWQRRELLRFINSDADVIRLYLRWLALLGVTQDRMRLSVCIHETADVEAAHRYWSAVVGVPREAFANPSLKRHKPVTVRKNTGAGYHGCLLVSVRKSAGLYQAVEGVWSALAAGAEV